ncbi:glyoxalase [Arthrobacter frigidicola]|nr:glyoxalase [Arthrobacter frigidicola]
MTAPPESAGPSDVVEAPSIPFRLEVVVLPVADVDRAKAFYTSLDWRLDADVSREGYRLIQFTPPDSAASIIFGTHASAADPGSLDGLLLVVDNIDRARMDLVSRGVEVSGVFHEASGGRAGGFHVDEGAVASGHDPDRRSYASYATFRDSEGNRWILQEVTDRVPGR